MLGQPADASKRGRVLWSMISAAAAALMLAACASTSGSTSPGAQPGTGGSAGTADPQILQPLEQPSVRCGPPGAEATLVRFSAADGTSLNGVLVGSGTAGVVLVHQSSPDDLCGFWPFAHYLAGQGMRAFAIDLRCFGRSACPDGEAAGRVIDDVAAAAAELRRRGVTRVAVVGASMGGSAALIAGTRVQPPLAGVVSLSGETDPTDLVGGIPLNAGAAVRRLTAPTMLVVATNDQYVSVEETRRMYRDAATRDKQLLALSKGFDGRHGVELLTDPATGRFTSVAAQVATFLTAHSR